MASPNYNRNGYIYFPATQINRVGLVGGLVANVYANTNQTPAATGALILDQFQLPANGFDVPGQYLEIFAYASTAANVNAKTLTINFGGTGSIGGAVTGGTTISTATTSTSAETLRANAIVTKTGASTQAALGEAQNGSTIVALLSTLPTATDTGNVLVNLVVNNATAAGDSTVRLWYVRFGM